VNTAAVRVSACWKYDCVLVCGFCSTKVHVVFQFAESSWNISPGNPASCSSLGRLLAAAMFRVSYMFIHVWPSLQSWSAAGAMVVSLVQLRWRHLLPGVVCEAWAWEVQAPRALRRTTPTCSRCPSMSWSTTWHRLAAVCWMTCDVCLRCRSDVDCVWRRYFGSRVFRMSWTFVRPPDIVARDTLSWFPDIRTQFVVTYSFICGPWGFFT